MCMCKRMWVLDTWGIVAGRADAKNLHSWMSGKTTRWLQIYHLHGGSSKMALYVCTCNYLLHFYCDSPQSIEFSRSVVNLPSTKWTSPLWEVIHWFKGPLANSSRVPDNNSKSDTDNAYIDGSQSVAVKTSQTVIGDVPQTLLYETVFCLYILLRKCVCLCFNMSYFSLKKTRDFCSFQVTCIAVGNLFNKIKSKLLEM